MFSEHIGQLVLRADGYEPGESFVEFVPDEVIIVFNSAKVAIKSYAVVRV